MMWLIWIPAVLLVSFLLYTIRHDRNERVVLATLLADQGYGLKLGDRIFNDTGVRINSGALYPCLRSLEERGLVESWEEPRPVLYLGGNIPKWARVRRVYRITPAGRVIARMNK